MKQNFFFLVTTTLLLFACNSTTTPEQIVEEPIDSISTTTEQTTVITPSNFPYLGETALQGFQQNKKHEYGGGDCMGEVFNYVSGTMMVAVDSMSCGDYGFTTTRYFLEGEAVKMVHIAKIDNTVLEFEEKIMDFRTTPYQLYEAKGKIKQGDYTQAYTNQITGGNLTKKSGEQLSPDIFKKEYLELFKRVIEDY